MASVLSNFLRISLPFSKGDAGKHTECEMVWDAVSSRALGPQGLLDLYFNLPLNFNPTLYLQEGRLWLGRLPTLGAKQL